VTLKIILRHALPHIDRHFYEFYSTNGMVHNLAFSSISFVKHIHNVMSDSTNIYLRIDWTAFGKVKILFE